MQTFGEWLSSFTTVPQIPASAVGRLLQPLGLRLDIGSNKAMLNRKLAELAVDGGLDFPGFLQVMEWMLEKDFCDINRLAAKHLETAAKVEEDESDFGDEEIVTITATAGRWRYRKGIFKSGKEGSFGFIECQPTREFFGRDVYVNKDLAAGLESGQLVCFNVYLNRDNMPNAEVQPE
eukprot:s4319_g2.t1